MTIWTVILLYPDYATGDFGADTYVGCSEANDPYTAAANVQWMASAANNHDIRAEDFRPIAVMRGEITLELDASNF